MTTLVKAIVTSSAIFLSACSAPQIVGGSLAGSADAVIEDGKPKTKIGVRIELDLVDRKTSSENASMVVPKSFAEPEKHQVQPILDLIGFAEGTDKGDGFDETLAYGAFTKGDVVLTEMTLDEIDALQTEMLRNPKNTFNSSAVGRYQIVRTTLRLLREELGLNGQLMFTPALQNRLAEKLLERRGYLEWKARRIGNRQFATKLCKEWASLPHPVTDKGCYGQNSGVSYATLEGVLNKMR